MYAHVTRGCVASTGSEGPRDRIKRQGLAESAPGGLAEATAIAYRGRVG